MKENILPAIRLTFVCLLFFSGIYTLIVFGTAQFSSNNGRGEVIKQDNKTYYANVGQQFTEDKYFYSRPSAVGYNAAGAGGSNKGPSNPDYLRQVQARIDTFLVHNPRVSKAAIPSELVTASGGGLDPNLSPAGALIQVKRISNLRHIPADKLTALVNEHIEKPFLGLFGPTKVNVLKLNLALDAIK